jgi:hypothetical protein
LLMWEQWGLQSPLGAKHRQQQEPSTLFHEVFPCSVIARRPAVAETWGSSLDSIFSFLPNTLPPRRGLIIELTGSVCELNERPIVQYSMMARSLRVFTPAWLCYRGSATHFAQVHVYRQQDLVWMRQAVAGFATSLSTQHSGINSSINWNLVDLGKCIYWQRI